jgi:predicted transcriptional regulator YdeE
MEKLDTKIIKEANELENTQEGIEIVRIDEDIKVFCITADSFPDGILDAHQRLHTMIPFSIDRRYFGISRPEKGVIVYKAAAEKLEKDEAEKLNCESFTIEKGKYICLTILNYVEDLQSISKAFERLISHSDIDPNGYCVEWYYTDKDVKCMVRLE